MKRDICAVNMLLLGSVGWCAQAVGAGGEAEPRLWRGRPKGAADDAVAAATKEAAAMRPKKLNIMRHDFFQKIMFGARDAAMRPKKCTKNKPRTRLFGAYSGAVGAMSGALI